MIVTLGVQKNDDGKMKPKKKTFSMKDWFYTKRF